MPENKSTYLQNIWTRERWVKERDDKKNGPVPKGATKVSMGDSLKKFHEKADKGPKEGHPAAEALKKTIETYKKAIKDKFKTFHALIETRLEKAVTNYIGEAKAILDGVKDYAVNRKNASEQMLVAAAEFQIWEKGGSQGAFKPSNKSTLEPALNAFYTSLEKASFYTDAVSIKENRGYKNMAFAAVSGTWNKKVVDELVQRLKDSPQSI